MTCLLVVAIPGLAMTRVESLSRSGHLVLVLRRSMYISQDDIGSHFGSSFYIHTDRGTQFTHSRMYPTVRYSLVQRGCVELDLWSVRTIYTRKAVYFI